jgi:hypothetical protein
MKKQIEAIIALGIGVFFFLTLLKALLLLWAQPWIY